MIFNAPIPLLFRPGPTAIGQANLSAGPEIAVPSAGDGPKRQAPCSYRRLIRAAAVRVKVDAVAKKPEVILEPEFAGHHAARGSARGDDATRTAAEAAGTAHASTPSAVSARVRLGQWLPWVRRTFLGIALALGNLLLN